ncbi:MAG: class I SAM-dependent methyltransferase [Candidatus Sumerlaeia bacterium]|nr:class I SAM-dependent methyltransferase [Candidatus Sumerlaeia bacterium]
MSQVQHRHFLPAAGHDLFLPLYDPLTRLLGADAARAQLIAQASLRPGQRVLEIGCGTGSLVVRLTRDNPEVEVAGLDPDPRALARARRKAERAGVSIRFEQGYADELPFEAGSFDAVFSSLMLHHLEEPQQAAALAEVRRVLRPGGALHLLDFAGAERPRGFLARLLHSDHQVAHGTTVLDRLRAAGFAEAAETGERSTFFGPVAFHRAVA